MTTDSLFAYFAKHQQRLECFLKDAIDLHSKIIVKQSAAKPLLDSLNYSCLDGGKRIRAMLVYMAAQACQSSDTDSEMIDCAAAAVELVHCYSLIHDDLPAMDDDELRRGKPSCHIAFGEANAILAGDALQALAFTLLTKAGNGEDQLRLKLLTQLTEAAGINGMVGGQAIDLAVTGKSLSYSELVTMHKLKTGALIEAAVAMGGSCSAASASQQQALSEYSQAIGLAFQIQDDILDIEGESIDIGKPQGADIAASKATYPAILGLEAAKTEAQALCDRAQASLSVFDHKAAPLRDLARFIIKRSN
ncbi:MAG: geranyl transferase [Cellvibrionales bacterium]|nr:geranyl transferase [Cellvibrionales bacterium]|tara:strand:+ start:4477 stop:5394 length:918 start_codon:yes stop_codon:yes gene_type:complete